MKPDLEHISALLRDVAGAEIMPRFRHTRSKHKADGSLVTAADIAVQARVAAGLDRLYPGVPVLGEEMSGEDQRRLLGEAGRSVWVLDPLDGTSNYACGFPGFSISLALMEGGRVVMGAVLDPIRDECFCAAAGAGAFLNGEPIHPYSPGPDLGDCIAVIDLKRVPASRVPALFRRGGFRSQRNLGSVALEWCWLAGGRFQLYLHGGQKLWDYSAGRLIAQEAGVPSRLYSRDGSALAEDLGLDQRLAVAAADERLLERWLAFVDLPFSPE